MARTNTSITTLLAQAISGAMKSITTGALGDAVLSPEKRDRFVQSLERRAPMLAATRRIVMTSFETDIDRITIGQVLEPPQAEGEEFEGETTPDTLTNRLHAVKARGRVKLSDEALADNIERENFEDTLVDVIAARAGVDLERLFVQGDTSSGDSFLQLLDGWRVKAGGEVDDEDFDATDVEDLFETMLLAVDDRFLEDRDGLRFWVPFHIENDYRNVLRDRGTDLGDMATTQFGSLAYKGVRVAVTPAMPSGGALLAHNDNLAYGIWKDIEVEVERKASHDRHDFHVRVRADANYEDEDGAVIASGYTGPAAG